MYYERKTIIHVSKKPLAKHTENAKHNKPKHLVNYNSGEYESKTERGNREHFHVENKFKGRNSVGSIGKSYE